MPDIIKTPPASKKYRANFDRIFTNFASGIYSTRIEPKQYVPSWAGRPEMIIKTMDGDIII